MKYIIGLNILSYFFFFSKRNHFILKFILLVYLKIFLKKIVFKSNRWKIKI